MPQHKKRTIKRKRKSEKERPLWVINRMPWSVGKPTYVLLMEVMPSSFDDVVKMENTRGHVSKIELYDFVANQLGPFFEKELPEGMLWRGRVFTAYVPPTGERNAKEDFSYASIGKGDDPGSGGGPDETVRADA